MRPSYLVKTISLYCLWVAQCYAIGEIRLDERSSLFQALDQSVPVVTARYIGWGENWAWAGAKLKTDGFSGKEKSLSSTYSGKIRTLDIDFSSTINLVNNQATWVYSWDKKTDFPNAIGFGIEFRLKLDSASFASPAKMPELLPGNQGWRWQTPDGQAIEVKFSPALAKVFFERNQKNKIRALFFTTINKGVEKTTMTVSLTGDKAKVSGPVALNYDGNTTQNWHQDILSDEASPVDLSFLNTKDLPAGKHGFVKAQGDQLVYSDGTPAKFWGANITAYSLFMTSDEKIKTHAKRIAQLGFNLIRIHHHDSKWVKPNVFNKQADNTRELSDKSLKKLDWWIKCLKDEGVYVWLDLHVGRAFTKNDGIENFEELSNRKQKGAKHKEKNKDRIELKGFNYYNESIQKQMQKFNEAYLNHVNAFTKLAYKDDPAVMALLVTNENDLTQHFGNLFLPNKGTPPSSGTFF